MEYAKPRSSSSTTGLSPSLWGDCPRHEIESDPAVGFYHYDNFTDLPTGRYTATQATAGTFARVTGERGIVAADAGSTTDGQGINVQLPFAQFKPQANSKIWFETRLKHVDSVSASPADFFVGLSEVDTTIIASSANTSANHVGFESVTTDGILLGYGEKAGTRNTGITTHTFVADTYVSLGFKIIGLTVIELYVNGVKVGTTIATANIPIVELTPSLVVQASGTAAAAPTVHADFWATYQLLRA